MRRKLLTSLAVASCAILGGLGSGASAARPEQVVRLALKAAAAPRGELVRTRSVSFRGFRVERYQQRVDGYPVIGGEATVIGPAGRASRLAADATSTTAAKAALRAAAPSISRSRAIARARRAGRVRTIRGGDRPSARLAVDRRRGGLLVWRVELPAARPMRDLEVLVDARSGRILSKANLLHYAHGTARLYVPNPPAEQGGYGGIGKRPSADNRDRDTHKLTRLREQVRLPRLERGQDCLKGRWAAARYDHPTKALCRPSRNWGHLTRSNDRFEALMAYFHVDRTQAYVQSLGFSDSNVPPNGIDDRRQHVVADAFRADNSFYSPQDRKIRYGAGGIDDAEDGDVIVHEYGHAMQDSQDPGFGCHSANFCQAGALGEGFGDYVSAMMSLVTPGLPRPAHAAFCIFDWDGVSGYNPRAAPCGRVANSSDGVTTLPDALAPRGPCDGNVRGRPSLDIHCVGEVWTHGLLDLRFGLGANAPVLDRDLLTSQFAYVDRETFPEAVDALVAADRALSGGANVAAICGEMVVNRGITGTTSCGA
jgi:Fungalysin/Thermolysin Propeptide Motif